MFSNIWNASIDKHADAHEHAEEVAREPGCSPGPPHHEGEEAEQHDRAEEAELLPHRREDEVGVLLGHEAALRLRALAETLAGEPAVRDRLLRLLLVVRVALRVRVPGIDERREPVDLVLLQDPEVDDRVRPR